MKLTSSTCLLFTLSSAVIHSDGPMPRHTTSKVIEGMTHEEHTTSSSKKFVHPFADQPEHLQSVQYPESNTFSSKLYRRPGGSLGENLGLGEMSKEEKALLWWDENVMSYLHEIEHVFWPAKATYTSPQQNLLNLSYRGELYIGTPQQKFLVVYDTGSGTFLLASDLCESCTMDKFYSVDSSSFEIWQPEEDYRSLYFDLSMFKGKVATERICPTPDVNGCAVNQKFVAVDGQRRQNSRDISGVLGMWSANTDEADQSKLFMNGFFDSSGITEKTFSFYMTDTTGQSYIDFGTPNPAAMRDPPIYIDIWDQNRWWTSGVTGFKWGPGHSDQTEYKLEDADNGGLTDTGSSCILGPPKEISYIRNTIANMVDGPKRYFSQVGYVFSCDAARYLPSFYLLFGGYWFEVTPADYLIAADGNNTVCTLCMQSSRRTGIWILGDAFMRGYYNIHEHENKRMGFSPFPGSAKSLPVAATSTPSEPLPLAPMVFPIIGMYFLAFPLLVWIVLCCCAYGCVRCIRVRLCKKERILFTDWKVSAARTTKLLKASHSDVDLVILD